MQSLIEIGPVVLEMKIVKSRQRILTTFLIRIISIGKGIIVGFYLNSPTRTILCAISLVEVS